MIPKRFFGKAAEFAAPSIVKCPAADIAKKKQKQNQAVKELPQPQLRVA